jgi:phage terminase large subunit
LQKTLIEPLCKLIPDYIGQYNGSTRTIYFANDSQIIFGHYDSSSSQMEYQGQEYDWIFIDEATQFTYDEFRTLGGCLRGANAFPKRFYLTCNPGGVGHAWVKRLFVDRDFITNSEDPEASENPDHYAPLIAATVKDNVALQELDPVGYANYLTQLANLPENIRNAHRYGDWNALAGQYFEEFTPDTHVIKIDDLQ